MSDCPNPGRFDEKYRLKPWCVIETCTSPLLVLIFGPRFTGADQSEYCGVAGGDCAKTTELAVPAGMFERRLSRTKLPSKARNDCPALRIIVKAAYFIGFPMVNGLIRTCNAKTMASEPFKNS